MASSKNQETVDKAVMELLLKVESKKKEIEKLKTRPSWKTNCTFGKDPDSTTNRTNIQTVKDTRKLLEFYAFLSYQDDVLGKTAKELDVDFDRTWLNYSINDWKEDIKTRLGQLSIEKKQKELDQLDARVNSLVSIEQRRIMELEALQKLLKD